MQVPFQQGSFTGECDRPAAACRDGCKKPGTQGTFSAVDAQGSRNGLLRKKVKIATDADSSRYGLCDYCTQLLNDLQCCPFVVAVSGIRKKGGSLMQERGCAGPLHTAF